MKNRRAILFLGLAALSGLATASAARKLRTEPDPGVPIVVASKAAPMGFAADAAELRVARWPRHAVPEGAFRSPGALEGRVLARAVVKGEAVLESALLPEGSQAGLGALISDKARAVSIKIDEYVGVGGFLQPGSHVDVLATRSGKSGATETLLQNVRVLAVDVRVERNGGDADQKVRVATLEVTPRQATLLTDAEHGGKLKLALRNPEDDTSDRPVQMVLGTDLHEMRF